MLVWVAGYVRDLNTDNLAEKIASLKEHGEAFAKIGGGIPIETIKTFEVTKSRRYKYMRVFYAEVEADKVPADSFLFSDESAWDMWKWIQD